ncbi:hypothetical protein OWV82_024334 [Melia azedarach]|uniref:Uncharacterized protein n=1 Tax=Melia azedarach TaxID=155640 RepID=A0ACC1WQ33_MELAZ|nr:hypothetical protein OWV82_024334 [Melia azedarach]
MCHYHPWEDDSPESEDNAPRTENVHDPIAVWQNRLDMLEVRVARIEDQVRGLQARMLLLQRALRVLCVLLIVTLAYALRR